MFKDTKRTIDGKEIWWCKFHKCPRGTYDGMYVIHPPENMMNGRSEKMNSKQTERIKVKISRNQTPKTQK